MGLLSSVAGVVTGAVGSLWQHNNEKDAAKRAFERNLYAWDLNNQYNTPSEQMKRLKEAGLNPNLVYGASAGSITGNASSGVSAPKANTSAQLLDYQRLLANDATIDNMRAEYAVREKTLDNLELQGRNIELQGDIMAWNLGVAKKRGSPVGDNSALSQYRGFVGDFNAAIEREKRAAKKTSLRQQFRDWVNQW